MCLPLPLAELIREGEEAEEVDVDRFIGLAAVGAEGVAEEGGRGTGGVMMMAPVLDSRPFTANSE